MNVFLTGLTGFCGSHIGLHLLKAGHSIWALAGRKAAGSPVISGKSGRLTIVDSDLARLSSLPPKMDAIIHMAAVSPTPETQNSDFVHHNILGTERVAVLAVGAAVRKFIFFSSLSLYGDIRTPVADENTPVLNPSPYGASKLFGEFLLRERVSEMNSIALRLPAVLGPGASRHWLATITAQAKRGQDVRIFNPNAPFNNAVHVQDLGEFVDGLLHREWTGFDGITLGAEGSLTIADVATRVVQAARTLAKVVIDPEPRPSFTISSERAKTVYGYTPRSLAAILTRYLSEF